MAWKLEVSDQARKQLRKIDTKQADRITQTMTDVAQLDNPRQRGHALAGDYGGHWRYRIGDYRVIAKIEDGRMVIIVVTIGHRREVYR
ncbi:type II toxin-antitoxin system RelE/ParE family toxin [Sphingopyxis sp. L1A2A]|uniref:type II toxin-antitoxin system RelE family toxin n=1 Tax=Sphingopyxis sp. L1A2A TaxID=2502247 RepID=UPI0010F4CFF6|nr:type II toxin-antitoxin system RelE/ParE family toxin [Sphingopyxis sp. L1A2A]